jgi:hypothetical protein
MLGYFATCKHLLDNKMNLIFAELFILIKPNNYNIIYYKQNDSVMKYDEV